MAKTKKTIFSLGLLTLFVMFQVSITMFTHVHYINGVMIAHSHPFHGKHSHESSSVLVIDRLSAFQSLEISTSFCFVPNCPVLCVLDGSYEVLVPTGDQCSVTTLRAPPATIRG